MSSHFEDIQISDQQVLLNTRIYESVAILELSLDILLSTDDKNMTHMKGAFLSML